MKTACFLLMTIGWAALMHGMAYATTLSPASQQTSQESAARTISNHPGDAWQRTSADSAKEQKNGKDSNEGRNPHHALERNLARGHASLNQTKRPTPVPSNRVRSGSATAINLRQPGSVRSGAEGKGLIQNETLKGIVPVRPPSAVRPASAARSNVRHRSPNPAIITGLVNSKTGNTGAINGSRMDRRR